jgi:MFS family permease
MEENGRLPDLAQVMNGLGFGKAQIRALVAGGTVLVADAAELLLISSVTRAVKEEWDLGPSARGLIVSIVFVGFLFGNLLGGYISDNKGRRIPIVLSFIFVFLFSVLSVAATGFYSMVVIRFFVGLACGTGHSAWVTLSLELAPADRRLHMVALGSLFFTVGEFWSAFLIHWDDPDMKNLDWRWLVVMGASPSLVLGVISYFFLTESPSYLAVNGRHDEARQIVRQLYLQNGHPDESIPKDFSPPKVGLEIDSGIRGVLNRLDVILGPSLLFTTIVTGFSCFCLNILFYGGLYSFPQMLPEMKTGLSPAASLMLAACQEIPGNVFGILVGVNLTRKLGIQCYLLGSMLSVALFTFAANQSLSGKGEMTFQLEVLLQVGLQASKAFVAVGFMIVYCYATEIYPTSVRGSGTSLCLSIGRIGSITSPLIYEWLTAFSGNKLAFLYFMMGCCAINIVLISFLTIETSGKPLKDDDDETTPLKARGYFDELLQNHGWKL